MDLVDKLIVTVLVLVVGPLLLTALLAIFVYGPVSIIAESKCLQRGYPKAAVDFRLNEYCMNMEGTVTVRVDQIR